MTKQTLFTLTLLCCFLQFVFVGTTIAQTGTEITVSSVSTATIGEEITVSVDVAAATEAVHAFEFSVAYDEAAFDVGAVVGADWVTSTGRSIACSAASIADGVITMACATVDDSCTGIVGPTGSGTLANITLIPTRMATTTIALDSVSLLGSADEIVVASTNSSTIVTSGSAPTAVSLQSIFGQDNLQWVLIVGVIALLLISTVLVKETWWKISVGMFVLTISAVSLFLLNPAVQAQTGDDLTAAMATYGCSTADSCYDAQYDVDSSGTIALSDIMAVSDSFCEAAGNNVDTTLFSNYLDSYEYMNDEFGTQVSVAVDEAAGTRTITSNTLPNHETGEFPNAGNPNTISEQEGSWEFPLEPTYAGDAAFAITPGVAINGVKLAPDTAERVNCDSGEVYQIEAIQDFTDLGLDFNNAHVQPTGEYHYHGASQLLVEAFDSGEDLVHVAFAADGYLMYYSKSGAYQPSYQLGTGDRPGTNCTYTLPGPTGGDVVDVPSAIDGTVKSDWVFDESYGELDECNGITIDGQYIYLFTDEYPYIPRCLMGEIAGGGGPGGGGPGGDGPPGG